MRSESTEKNQSAHTLSLQTCTHTYLIKKKHAFSLEGYMGCTELVPVESLWHEYKQVSTSVTNVREDNYICTADISC